MKVLVAILLCCSLGALAPVAEEWMSSCAEARAGGTPRLLGCSGRPCRPNVGNYTLVIKTHTDSLSTCKAGCGMSRRLFMK